MKSMKVDRKSIKKNIDSQFPFLIDLRKVIGNKVDFQTLIGELFVFTEEEKVNNKTFFSVKTYNVLTGQIDKIIAYEIPMYEFTSQTVKVYGNKMQILKSTEEACLTVVLVNLNTKEVEFSSRYDLNGSCSACPIFINEQYVMIFIDHEDDEAFYLVDIEDDNLYRIDDARVSASSIEHSHNGLPVVSDGNKDYIFLNETYMSDYEYELDIYDQVQSGQLLPKQVKWSETLYKIELKTFIQTIKRGKGHLDLEVVCSRHIDGWVRSYKSDKHKLYYREKDFETQIERVWCLDLLSETKSIYAEIDHRIWEDDLYYVEAGIYHVSEGASLSVKGLKDISYALELPYRKRLWFEGLVENRYAIMTYWDEDEEDRYYEYVQIYDLRDKAIVEYTGDVKVVGELIFLLDRSAYH